MPNRVDKSKVNQQIDENLKRVFDNALSEEVPDKFLDLIAQLKAKEQSANAK